jgi:hypothetical protein
MPEQVNGQWGATDAELLLCYRTVHNLKQFKKRYPQNFVKLQWGGNGRYAVTLFDTLRADAQQAIGDPRQIKHVFEKHYRVDNEARRFFSQYQFSNGYYLTADHQDKYIVNASVVRAIMDFKAALERERKHKGLNTRGIDEVLRGHAITFQKTLQIKHNCQHTLPESLKRFKSCLNAFEKQGYVSLISGKHGNDNSRKVTDDVMALLESMFAKSTGKPSYTGVSRQYNKFLNGQIEIVNNGTCEVYNPSEFLELSEYTIYKYLTSWKSSVGTALIRTGDRQKYIAKLPYSSLNKPTKAGSLLSIDDRQPPFVMPDGKRIWLYIGMDVASGACVCIVAAKTKEYLILKFYRELVRNYAAWGLCLPDGLEAESSLNSSFKETFLAEGVMFQNVRIEANNAQGKIIENFNGRMRYGIEKAEQNWNARPFARKESNQAGNHKVEAMEFKEIVQLCFQNYETWNNMPHDTEPNTCRWDYFLERQHPDLKPINYKAILPHLGYKKDSSCNRGEIKLNNGEYLLGENGEVCIGDQLISLMERVEGRSVIIYWIDDHDGKVLKALVYISNLLICEAVAKPRFNRAPNEQTDDDRNAMAIMSAYRATVEAYGRRSKNAIEKVTIIDHTPKPERKFKMPGLKYYDPADIKSGGLLPEPVEHDGPIQSFAKSLKDRF